MASSFMFVHRIGQILIPFSFDLIKPLWSNFSQWRHVVDNLLSLMPLKCFLGKVWEFFFCQAYTLLYVEVFPIGNEWKIPKTISLEWNVPFRNMLF